MSYLYILQCKNSRMIEIMQVKQIIDEMNVYGLMHPQTFDNLSRLRRFF